MNILKLLRISILCCIGLLNISNGYTTQSNNVHDNNSYQLVQTIEWTWNNIPVFPIENRDYILISNGINNYYYNLYSKTIIVYSRINEKLQYTDEETTNKFTELANRTNNLYDLYNSNNIVHELFGDDYKAYLSLSLHKKVMMMPFA